MTTTGLAEHRDTRTRILDAAEVCFARDGFHAATMRSITAQAGVNLASAHYHFGTKDDLLRAVLDRIVEPLNARRLALLDVAREPATDGSGDEPLPLDVILDAFLRPDLEAVAMLRSRNPDIARFIARLYAAPEAPVADFVDAQFAATGERFVGELARALPELDPAELQWRLGTLVVGMIIAVFGQAHPDTDDVDRLLERMIAVLAPALSAPAR